MSDNIIFILPGNNKPVPTLFFDLENTPLSQREVGIIKDDIYPFLLSAINSVIENFDNLDFLNKKFDELREKETEGHITTFEKFLLYEIIEKRILEFPNPYLPKDHDRAMEISNRYLRLEREFDKKYKKRSWKNLFGAMFSWLG